MAGEPGPARRDDFRLARIAAALAIFGTVVAMALVDAVSSGFAMDPVVLGLLIIAGLTLLGLPIPSRLGGSDR